MYCFEGTPLHYSAFAWILGLTNLAQKTLVEEHLIQHCNACAMPRKYGADFLILFGLTKHEKYVLQNLPPKNRTTYLAFLMSFWCGAPRS